MSKVNKDLGMPGEPEGFSGSLCNDVEPCRSLTLGRGQALDQGISSSCHDVLLILLAGPCGLLRADSVLRERLFGNSPAGPLTLSPLPLSLTVVYRLALSFLTRAAASSVSSATLLPSEERQLIATYTSLTLSPPTSYRQVYDEL